MYKTRWSNKTSMSKVYSDLRVNPCGIPFPLVEIIQSHISREIAEIHVLILLTILLIENEKEERADLQNIKKYLEDHTREQFSGISEKDLITEIEIKDALNHLMRIGFVIKE